MDKALGIPPPKGSKDGVASPLHQLAKIAAFLRSRNLVQTMPDPPLIPVVGDLGFRAALGALQGVVKSAVWPSQQQQPVPARRRPALSIALGIPPAMPKAAVALLKSARDLISGYLSHGRRDSMSHLIEGAGDDT